MKPVSEITRLAQAVLVARSCTRTNNTGGRADGMTPHRNIHSTRFRGDEMEKPTYDPNVDVEYTLRIAIDGKEEVRTWRETKPWSQTPFSNSDPK